MDRETLVQYWQQCITSETFLTPKHDPCSVGEPHSGYRSVTIQDPSGISQFLSGGDYRVHEYANVQHPQSPQYFVVEPNDPNTVAGSGIPPLASGPTTALDRFVVVSGTKTGWHIYAESQATISQKASDGSLVFQRELL